MLFKKADIGIDLGTANIMVYLKGKGIVLREPSVVAIDKNTNRILAMGNEAKTMLGRTPGNIVAIRPMREGVIADYDITQSLLEHVIRQVAGKSMFFKPKVVICIPSGVTTVEKRAVLEAAIQSGASKTYLVEEPIAAAMGAGLEISESRGAMVVDIGGGTTDIAVMSLGGVVVSDSLRVGGDKFDEAIIRFVKKKHNVLIGEPTAEEIKIKVATVFKGNRQATIDVRGRDLVSGLPTTITLMSDEIYTALAEPVSMLVGCVRSILEKTPPELSADIIDRGIVLTGGSAMIDGMPELINSETGIATFVADNPLECVAIGTGKVLSSLDKLKDSVIMTHSK
ncbi:MAG TPA: rod shape-determining protein MreB [Candidatus Avacidaminococcus intestinavium]|uniref:Cell shape-determining protein MreB n=1 Tax=Candidatus Avacidaminococcus intestinavium TaxID=2840684 RepID=A0A9D1SL96_9FIRM|nr:rod shape-determining protein MreB [Candidatus Avacidaminococcus intestinavium]